MISIIDDDDIVRDAIGDLLQSLGHKIATFESAEDFLQSGCLRETACVIADVQMAGLNGLDLQDRLLADGHRTPVIFVTAFPEERYRKRAMSAGAVCFLSKPFNEDCLIRCLDTALDGSRIEKSST
jgi:FixJ family two-component response regulator